VASGLVDVAILAGAEVLLHRVLLRRTPTPSPWTQLQRLLVAGCYFVGAVGLAGRTGGQALFGLRVVDAVTGGRPAWRASLLWWAVRQPPEICLLPLSTSSRLRDTTTKLREVQPEVDELRRRFGRDRRCLDEAIMKLYQSRGVDPWRGYKPLLVGGVVAAAYGWTITAGTLIRSDRRGLHDRLAGVLVVREWRGS
jgi:uncharacterized RDD family membrane protein YckC